MQAIYDLTDDQKKELIIGEPVTDIIAAYDWDECYPVVSLDGVVQDIFWAYNNHLEIENHIQESEIDEYVFYAHREDIYRYVSDFPNAIMDTDSKTWDY